MSIVLLNWSRNSRYNYPYRWRVQYTPLTGAGRHRTSLHTFLLLALMASKIALLSRLYISSRKERGEQSAQKWKHCILRAFCGRALSQPRACCGERESLCVARTGDFFPYKTLKRQNVYKTDMKKRDFRLYVGREEDMTILAGNVSVRATLNMCTIYDKNLNIVVRIRIMPIIS